MLRLVYGLQSLVWAWTNNQKSRREVFRLPDIQTNLAISNMYVSRPSLMCYKQKCQLVGCAWFVAISCWQPRWTILLQQVTAIRSKKTWLAIAKTRGVLAQLVHRYTTRIILVGYQLQWIVIYRVILIELCIGFKFEYNFCVLRNEDFCLLLQRKENFLQIVITL